MHDLLRAYAEELAGLDGETEQRAAKHRMFDHYWHTAGAAAARYTVQDATDLGAPRRGVTLTEFPDADSARAWFEAEHAVLLAVIRAAASHGWDRHVAGLVRAVSRYLDFQGQWRELAEVLALAIASARRSGDLRAAGFAHRCMATAAIPLGRPGRALHHLHRALRLARELGNATDMAHTHIRIAWVLAEQERLRPALRHGRRSLALYRAGDHPRGVAHALNALGWFHARRGEPDQTIAYCQQALTHFGQLDDDDGAAATWDTLGSAHQTLGEYEAATRCFTRAVELVRRLGNRYYEALGLSHLGDAFVAAGDTVAARDARCGALSIMEELDHPEAAGIRAKLTDVDQTSGAAPG